MEELGHLIDECGDLARPEVIFAVLYERLIAPAKAKQINGVHPVGLCQLIDVVPPVVCTRSKPMYEQQRCAFVT